MQLTSYRYLVTYDADKASVPEELRENLSKYGRVVYISGSVYGIYSKNKQNVRTMFNELKSYINEPEDNLFIAHLSSNIPSFDHFLRK